MKPLFLILLGAVGLWADTLVISPPAITLQGPEARQQLVAEATTGKFQEDLTRHVTWSSSNPEIVTVDQSGLLKPIADGQAVITAKGQSQTATVTVKVKDAKAPFTWSFRNNVVP